tara:strand:- start:414 stop:719 length:306 start_codon:yes stop_codon:yes gene_type:complete
MTDILYYDIKGNSMLPTYKDGETICCKKYDKYDNINLGDVVVFNHPFKNNFKIIKRVTKIKDKFQLFVEGDNQNISSSEDSHSFGYINRNQLIAIIKRNFK